ncbi:MAG: type IX secretion system protein PorQ [Bacteroidales bacterium]
MKKYFLFFSGLFCCFFLLNAQNGHSVFGFLDFPASSHANALGGANISLVDTDLSMANQNPALLGAELANQVALNYMHYIKEVNVGGALYAHALGERGAWAVGAQFVDYGKFIHTSADNQVLGTFGAKDIAVNGMIGYDIASRIRGGVNAKFIYSAYESYSSVALAVDLGLNYYNEEKDLSFAILARNLGGQLKPFDEVRESLPFDLQLGYTQSMAHAPFRFSVTAINLTSWKTDYIDDTPTENSEDRQKKSNFAKDLFRHIVIGVEYIPTDRLYVALGYNYKKRSDFADGGGGFFTGFSGGAGLKVRMFDFNASVARYHRSGTSFMIGVNLMLDKF